MTLLTASVCTGYAGLDRAVHEVIGGELAWVADNDEGASKILAYRYPDVPNLGDITAVDWSAVEPVDVLTAGFPCQDVSCAGARAGLREGNRTGVWAHVAHAISELRPGLVVLENVRGLLSAGADSDVEPCPWCLGESGMEHALRACGAVLGDLADLLYDTRGAVVSAAEAGAPHRRERVFIVAWPAADASGGELQRRRIAGVLGSATAGEPSKGDQRKWAGDAAGDSGAAAAADAGGDGHGRRAGSAREADEFRAGSRTAAEGCGTPAENPDRAASGERGQSAPGQATGGWPRADAGRSGGASTTADACGEGLEIGAVEHHGPERQAAERGRGDAAAYAEYGAEPEWSRDTWREARERAPVGSGPERDSGSPAHSNGPDAGPNARGSGEAFRSMMFDGAERRSESGPGISGGTPADSGSSGRRPEPGLERGLRPAECEPGDIAWGAYELAIRRWERVLGRPAPAPTEPGRTGQRLSPRFVEFLMGLPEGWVTDVPGLSRNAQLKALGNGVVIQQCALALRLLLGDADLQREVA